MQSNGSLMVVSSNLNKCVCRGGHLLFISYRNLIFWTISERCKSCILSHYWRTLSLKQFIIMDIIVSDEACQSVYRLGHVNFKFWKMNLFIFHFLNFQNLKLQFKFQILRIWNSNSNFQTGHSFSNESCQFIFGAENSNFCSSFAFVTDLIN